MAFNPSALAVCRNSFTDNSLIARGALEKKARDYATAFLTSPQRNQKTFFDFLHDERMRTTYDAPHSVP
jgi:hypothetical protein